jgi:hypothetical protein
MKFLLAGLLVGVEKPSHYVVLVMPGLMTGVG